VRRFLFCFFSIFSLLSLSGGGEVPWGLPCTRRRGDRLLLPRRIASLARGDQTSEERRLRSKRRKKTECLLLRALEWEERRVRGGVGPR
jgi:hypothetical protein